MGKVCFFSLCVCLCLNLVYGQYGFFPQRTDRRISSPFRFAQNLFTGPNGLRNTLTNILHLRPETPASNPAYIYPFPNRPVQNNQFDQDQLIHNNEFIQNRPIHNNQFDQNRPISNNEFDQNRPVNNEYDEHLNNNQFDQNGQLNNNQFQEYPPEHEISPPKKPVRFPNDGLVSGNVNYENQQSTSNPFVDPNPEYVERPKGTENEFGNGNEIPLVTNKPEVNVEDNVNDKPTFAPVDKGNVGLEKQDKGSADENRHGIPNAPPPGFLQTTLPPLTPVPLSASRNNFNFGAFGIFKETCTTIDGGVGSCLSITTCGPYVKILQQARTNPEAVKILRKAHCGFEGNNPKVCCPRETIPDVPPPVPTSAPSTLAPVTHDPGSDTASGKSLPSSDYLDRFPVPPECGVSNASFSRVVGGVDAKLGDFPWMALLGYKGRSGSPTRWLCGGSLISTHHILTAAHCIHNHENDLYVVRLGELDLAREDEGAIPIDVLIKYKMKHEGYNPKSFTNDIGLLVLEQRIQFTDLIKPICIPDTSELRANNFENYNPFIAGWGDTEFRGPSASHLQVLQLPVVSNEYCKNAYSSYKAQVIDERVLCAGFKKGGKDACQGDSGGPLMQPIYYQQNLTTYIYQIGVVSYGKRCAEAGFPGVYSRITHFVPWLSKYVLGIE